MMNKELTRQQRKIDYVYQLQLDTIKQGLIYQNADFIQIGTIKARLVVDIMEALKLHSRSHCICLRAEIEELRGKKYEYS